MATGYRAWDPKRGCDVALKILNRGLVQSARHLDRFRREARLISQLDHPRIVRVHGYGERDGNAYLSMEVVEGPTLTDLVSRSGILAPVHAAQIVKQVASAVDAAHHKRVVHRDLKPSNVILHPDEGPVVLDFGLAKDLARDLNLTEAGEIFGTPNYLAPEQALPAGFPVDHRVDVHGLGALLFFVLTGRPPHSGATAVAVVQHLLHNEPPRLREVDPSLPRPLEIICAKALSRDPHDRYQTAAELADDLTRFQSEEPIHAQLPGAVLRLGRHMRRHPVASGLALTLALLTVGGSLAMRSLNARLALVQVKRERAESAESNGNWALAEELRQDLARLQGLEPLEDAPKGDALIAVDGLTGSAHVVFHAWEGEGFTPVVTATAEDPEVSLQPGTYVAVHVGSANPLDSYLVVVGAGHRHRIHVGKDSPAPPGAIRLPPVSALEAARKRSQP
jgi:serine/threonine protein kinase